MNLLIYTLLFLFYFIGCEAKVLVGSDLLFTSPHAKILNNKKIGLITNHTAVSSKMESTIDLLQSNESKFGYTLKALFAPEHGINGSAYASEVIHDTEHGTGIPIYSLHGKTRRPTETMLKGLTLLIYDIQDVGSRSYTYITTLFYVMEEAARAKIPVIVLDRPNPINGMVVDGPMMEDKWRSMVGYVNVPYCHGMTVGELAEFFNHEYKVGCHLHVVPMKGWNRMMCFADTGLSWIPTSPHIPEAATALYYPITGIIGELSMVNNGVGYTLPFKLIGAPWIQPQKFAKVLNQQKLPGIHFEPLYYKPFYGKFSQQDCGGVMVVVTDPIRYRPVTTQYLLIGALKNLYPKEFMQALEASANRMEMFHKVNGTEEVYKILTREKYIIWPLRKLHSKEREAFLSVREKYLIPNYMK